MDTKIQSVGLLPCTSAQAKADTSLLCLSLSKLVDQASPKYEASQRHSFLPCGSLTKKYIAKLSVVTTCFVNKLDEQKITFTVKTC